MNKLLYTFCSLGYVNESNEKIIVFGLKRVCEFIRDWLFTILCGAIMGSWMTGLIFQSAYILLRVYAGGYHAESEKKCRYITDGSTICCLGIVNYISIPRCIQFVLIAISILCILCFSPVESSRKPLSNRERKVYRKRSLIVAFAEVITYFIELNLRIETFAKATCIAMGLVSLGMAAGIMCNYRCK